MISDYMTELNEEEQQQAYESYADDVHEQMKDAKCEAEMLKYERAKAQAEKYYQEGKITKEGRDILARELASL